MDNQCNWRKLWFGLDWTCQFDISTHVNATILNIDLLYYSKDEWMLDCEYVSLCQGSYVLE